MRAGGGNDIIVTSQGENELLGRSDNDQLWGGEDFSKLFGGKGDDQLYDIYGGDSLTGGTGNDHFNIIADYDFNRPLTVDVEFPDTISGD